MPSSEDSPPAVGVVMAGGLARRMEGRDKGLAEIGGQTILDRVLARLAPQVRMTVLNANGDPARFTHWTNAVAPDVLPDNPGPLVGVLTGMDWAVANTPGLDWVVTVPTDAPFLPKDLVARLFAAIEAEGSDMACAASGGRVHPVIGLWPVALRMKLRQAMVGEGVRKVDEWTGRYRVSQVDFGDHPVDPFFNANTPEDLEEAEALLRMTE